MIKQFLKDHKYALLLVALLQHLYIGIFVNNIEFYTEVLWPVNMGILGLASIGVFLEKGRAKIIIKNILALVVIAFPVLLPFFKTDPVFLFLLNVSYVVYYLFIFYEVLKFLLRPGYINSDIIVAAACGFFLLLETFVFLLQIWVYDDPGSFRGIDRSTPAHTFIDLVYFCSITLTTIGFGDITPAAPDTKLISSLIGIIGQFYSVVLVGITISKFAASSKPV